MPNKIRENAKPYVLNGIYLIKENPLGGNFEYDFNISDVSSAIEVYINETALDFKMACTKIRSSSESFRLINTERRFIKYTDSDGWKYHNLDSVAYENTTLTSSVKFNFASTSATIFHIYSSIPASTNISNLTATAEYEKTGITALIATATAKSINGYWTFNVRITPPKALTGGTLYYQVNFDIETHEKVPLSQKSRMLNFREPHIVPSTELSKILSFIDIDNIPAEMYNDNLDPIS
jgi:hypothetical protein